MSKHEHTEPSAVRALAQRLCAIRTKDIPAAAMEQAKLIVVDTIGCGLAGLGEETSHAVVGLIDELGGAGRCSVFGRSQRTSILNAVLANGCLARVLDLNDYIGGVSGKGPQIGGHPSDNVPTALAIGEAFARNGADVLAAVVIGYEIFGGLKQLMNPVGVWDEVTVSGLVAPAMSGWLMGLDEERLSHALALGAARAATPAVVRGGHVSAAKSIANALVAQSGVQGALLAARGVTGPLAVLENERGLREAFGEGDAYEILAAPMPEKLYIMRANVKMYPCLATGQAAVAAALKLRAMVGGNFDALSHIEVVMADYPIVKRQQVDKDRMLPKSREAADHSFTFLVAVSLIDGEFGLKQYDNERWLDPQVIELMKKLTMSTDATYAVRAPGSYSCALRARGMDGSELVADVPFPPGFSQGGLERAAVVEKFNAVTREAADERARGAIVDAVFALDKSVSLDELMLRVRLEP